MILGLENRPQTVSQLASQSHMFYISGGRSIDKNISLSYWFVIDCYFLITQWLMIVLFFGPEGHMSYSFNSLLILSFTAESIIKLAWIQFQLLHLGAVLVPWSLLFSEFLCLISHSLAVWHFWKPCSSSWTQHWLSIERTDVEAETPILWPPDVKSWLIWKDHDAGKDWGQEKGTTEDEMVGWYHWLDGHGFG